ncbi:MAG: FtsX-like permease family protein [Terriglobia bacterium]|nr:FtsX-like permease family protein [Terriglobia bacterium]
MRFLPFVLKHLRRNWVRTTSTILALALCIFLLCTLESVLAAVSWSLKSASAARLVTRHQVSLAFELPLKYEQEIATIPGVKSVARESWFMGVYKGDFKYFFPNLAVEAEPFLAMYPEFQLPADQKQAFLEDMRGCIVGRKTAERWGWKVGDTFQMESAIPPYRIGHPFEFVIRGIYDADLQKNPGTDLTMMYFHHKYLYESTGRRVQTGIYVVQVDDPSKAGEISKKIDAMFENSAVQTRTETEAAFRAGFVAMAGNLALLLRGIGLAVTFTILLVTANTMSMSVRERRNEIAVLKTLGFSGGLVMALILAEALAMAIIGGALGVFLSRGAITALPGIPFIGDVVRGFPDFGLQPRIVVLGLSGAVLLGLLAGFVPALLAYRARITDMLRQL